MDGCNDSLVSEKQVEDILVSVFLEYDCLQAFHFLMMKHLKGDHSISTDISAEELEDCVSDWQ